MPIHHLQLRSKCSKRIRYLLCAIDLFSKYAWVVPLKYKKELLLLMHLKVFSREQKEKQTKYGLIKAVNFITVLSKNGQNRIT